MSDRLSSPYGRLRLSMAVLALMLVSIVLGLLHSALVGLEEQRALRHRMVAERVFDEVEREIGSVLQHEAQRPSQAYDAEDTDPARWSAFVLGYYRRDPELVVLAEERLAPSRVARLRALLSQTRDELRYQATQLAMQDAALRRAARRSPSATVRPNLDDARSVPTNSPDLLRLLNRSDQLRKRRMREFERSFALSRVAEVLVAERLAADAGRAEGLVMDVSALLAGIVEGLFDAQRSQAAPLLTLGTLPPLGAAEGGYRYIHRLTSPLQAYRVTLTLPPLADADADADVVLYGLAGLFTAATVIGLMAVYRMLAVQVAFTERRNNFVSAVTHELRTPLTTIRMYAEMLRDGIVSDEATKQEYYATITSEGERLTRLINNVMEHARLRRGQRRVQLQRADPGALVREVVEIMRPHLEREGFTVDVRVTACTGLVQVDGDALKQILFNILDNARKYGRGEEQARVEVLCDRNEAGEIVLSVRDWGSGVPEARLETVFEPFYRGESELTRENQGTGLGLALVRDLACLMQGRVEARNRAPGLELRVTLHCS